MSENLIANLERLTANPTFVAALIALVGVIFAAMVNIIVNYHNAKALRKRPFLEKQLELCLEASTLAAILATTRNEATFKLARARFLELYWGPLSVVEDVAVEAAMVEFEEKLEGVRKTRPGLPLCGLQIPSYDLARQIRTLILRSWSIESLGRVLKDRPRQRSVAGEAPFVEAAPALAESPVQFPIDSPTPAAPKRGRS